MCSSDLNDFNYYRGNVYTKNAINDDGSVKIITSTEIIYDTLPNGNVIARNLPGEILQVPIDENETFQRTNFDRSNETNFRDGDKRSSRQYDNFYDDDNSIDETSLMYNSPKTNIRTGESGKIIKEYDTANNRTTLISDEVRVYKGGSWKDREYWLDPAQRRYFPQYMATDYIGFRCAMSRVGSKSKTKKKRKN